MNRREIYFRGLGVALVALALILFMSFISYNRGDYPLPNVNPVNSGLRQTSAAPSARTSHGCSGFSSGSARILLVFAIAVIGGLMIIAQPISDPLVRGLGAGLFLLAWCALASCLLDPIAMPGGAGGIIGHFIREVLLRPLGIGGYVAALAALVLGALLAADAWVLWLGRKGVEMVTMHGEAASSCRRGDGGESRRGDRFQALRRRAHRRAEGVAAQAPGGAEDSACA